MTAEIQKIVELDFFDHIDVNDILSEKEYREIFKSYTKNIPILKSLNEEMTKSFIEKHFSEGFEICNIDLDFYNTFSISCYSVDFYLLAIISFDLDTQTFNIKFNFSSKLENEKVDFISGLLDDILNFKNILKNLKFSVLYDFFSTCHKNKTLIEHMENSLRNKETYINSSIALNELLKLNKLFVPLKNIKPISSEEEFNSFLESNFKKSYDFDGDEFYSLSAFILSFQNKGFVLREIKFSVYVYNLYSETAYLVGDTACSFEEFIKYLNKYIHYYKGKIVHSEESLFFKNFSWNLIPYYNFKKEFKHIFLQHDIKEF